MSLILFVVPVISYYEKYEIFRNIQKYSEIFIKIRNIPKHTGNHNAPKYKSMTSIIAYICSYVKEALIQSFDRNVIKHH
jgi:hypothetical protein